MRRFLFLVHRYLGIGIGLIMAIWCLSGFVMMYMPYPSVSQQQLLRGNVPLDWQGCCDTSAFRSLGLVDINRFTVEMVGASPVVRFRASGRQNPIVDLSTSARLDTIPVARIEAVARVFKAQSNIDGEIVGQREVTRDQWTVTRYYDYHRPLHVFSADDPEGTEWYVSSATGEIVQLTTARQRFWNWLGSVPHWLYPTVLRQNDALWAQVVIGLSLAGVFLTAIGIYIGISQFKTLRSGRRSPYRGLALWHHYTGLVFGVFILTWVTSGLFSMNPWNLFDLGGGDAERKRIQGLPLYSGEVENFIDRLPQADLSAETVRIEGYALFGKLYFLAYMADGSYRRFDGRSLQPRPINKGEWQRLNSAVTGDRSIASSGLLQQEDAYYYRHKAASELPVYRIILDNDDRTRFYLNATSGELMARYGRERRIYRWLFSGLHQLDLTRSIRSRPLWDILTWVLLLGVTLGTVTGTYMGFRRLTR
ncbi:MAG: hypothetical protein WDZ30_02105 [Cellvibrionaceae bacterium]